ncbi:MAG: hypothetical protein LBH07_04240 [Treponema sp.]|nr:hypothetical protein [Treponema sp.]
MTNKEVLLELQQMSIEEKIARLSPTEEAYVRGLIDGAILDNQELQNLRAGILAGKVKLGKTGVYQVHQIVFTGK